jgi:hypothetical protein
MMARHGCGMLFCALCFSFSVVFRILALSWAYIVLKALLYRLSCEVAGIVVVSCRVQEQDSLPQIYKTNPAATTDKLCSTS